MSEGHQPSRTEGGWNVGAVLRNRHCGPPWLPLRPGERREHSRPAKCLLTPKISLFPPLFVKTIPYLCPLLTHNPDPLMTNCRKERKTRGSKMTSREPKTSLQNAYPPAKRLPPKVEGEVEADEYCTPGAFELERLFWKGSPQYTHVNEVWPQLYIGDE